MIEAYTSFTYMLLSIIPPILNIQPQIVFKIVSFIFFLLIIRRLYRSSENKTASLFAIFLFTANWQTHVHIYSCLETMFWFWLQIEFFFLIYENKIDGKQQYKLWFIALLFPLTRPEGAVFSLFLFVYIVFIKKQKLYLVAFLFFVSLGILYFIWRYNYFGMLLPLPFYHKSFSNYGLRSLMIAFNTIAAYQYLFFIFFILFISYKNKFISTYFIVIALLIFFASYAPSFLFMNYASRFPYQVFFPSILFSLLLYLNKIDGDNLKKRKVYKIIVVFVFWVYITGFFSVFSFSGSSIKDHIKWSANEKKSYINIGLKLSKLKDKNVKVLLAEAGKIAYLSQLKCYDFLGLADPYLSKNKMNIDYFNKINADVILFSVLGNTNSLGKQKNLKSDILSQFSNNNTSLTYQVIKESDKYEEVEGSVDYINRFYYFKFYIRKDSKYKHEIREVLNEAIKESNEFKFSVKDFLTFKYLFY